MNKIGLIVNWFKSFPGGNNAMEQRQSSTTQKRTYVPNTMFPRYGGDYSVIDIFGGRETPLTVSTVFRCVTLLAESVAKLPIRYLEKKNGVYSEDPESRFAYLLTVQPNEWMNAFDFWTMVVKEMLLDGNAYILPQYNMASMEIDRLVLLSRGSVTKTTFGYTINDMKRGISGEYDFDEVIHLMGKTFDGENGVSVLTYARMSIDISRTGDKQTLSNFENGGMIRGIVGNAEEGTQGFGEYQDNELEKAAKDVDEQFRNGKRIVSLPGQVEFRPISMSSADMQFLDSRKFSVVEICRFFGVHPSFVFVDSGSNYKSAEMANISFLNTSLDPILCKIETELRSKLIAPRRAMKAKFMFDRESLNLCDLDSRVSYLGKALAAGTVTINEARKKCNMAPVDGGDVPLASANLKSVEELIHGKNNE